MTNDPKSNLERALAAYRKLHKEVRGSYPSSSDLDLKALNEKIEALLDEKDRIDYSDPDPDDDFYDDFYDEMDGDHESALASAGFGTDEDYGCYGDDGDF